MELKMNEVPVGGIFKFIPSSASHPKEFYIARVASNDEYRVKSSHYVSNEHDAIFITGGEFVHSIYTVRRCTNEEVRRYKGFELLKTGKTMDEPLFQKGDQVRYLGEVGSCAISCCFNKDEIVEIVSASNHGSVTVKGGNGAGIVEQTVNREQLKLVKDLKVKKKSFPFAIGQKIIGNAKANSYGCTTEGWVGTVLFISDSIEDTMMDTFTATSEDGGNEFAGLDPDCFDLFGVTMPRITIPVEGWCLDANDALGRYLANRHETSWMPPGAKGYAWNDNSFWAIQGDSGKPIIAYASIEHLLVAYEKISEYPRHPSEINKRTNYYVGDTVRVTQLNFSSIVTDMKPMLGKMSRITHVNTDNSYRLMDGWNYAYKDVELYARGQIGMDADRSRTLETIYPLSGVGAPRELVPKIFREHEHVYLVGELEESLREYISYIGFVIRDTADGFVTVTFIKENGNRVQGTVKQGNLVRSTQNVTNSPKDLEAKKLKLKETCNFVQGRNVKVVLVVHGKPWKRGDVGVVVKVLEDYCRVRIFSGADKGTIYKIHKRYLDVTGEKLTIRIPEDDTHTFYKQSSTVDKYRYVMGVDPINDENGEGLIMRPDTPGKPLKLRKHLVGYGPAITNRVVEARHTPNKPDEWKDNPLVIEVDPVTDRTIKVRIK